jgi:hypothetical protein
MRTLSFLLCGLACLSGAFDSSARAEGKLAPFSIRYAHARLTEIVVKDGKLRYVWHTPRRQDDSKVPVQASLASYDLHQVDIWLTGKEAGRFRNWIDRHKVFSFDRDYPSVSGGKSRGAAFGSGLSVALGGKNHGVSWVGDSKTPKELGAAIKELIALADEIQKSRSK